MINYCALCMHNDVCKHKERRAKIEKEIHPFKVHCPFYSKVGLSNRNIEIPPVITSSSTGK